VPKRKGGRDEFLEVDRVYQSKRSQWIKEIIIFNGKRFPLNGNLKLL
jgi:hypothetical protein